MLFSPKIHVSRVVRRETDKNRILAGIILRNFVYFFFLYYYFSDRRLIND